MIQITFNESELLRVAKEGAKDDLRQRGTRVLNLARQKAPKDTGELAGSGQLEILEVGGVLTARISFTAKHAMWVHEGTGIYGPRGAMIYPTAAKFMVWRSKTGQLIFARKTRGMRGRPFLTDALDEAR